ncbi:MAG: oxygen-dependent coproporphyrinogen oxidase [Bacteroidetes bacterium]|nr:oxygen-dependent coproporphyrinogen oxidase [Bacteroidota bacterium]HET6244667.1 oxygen-dependent coproporphyrinogen oxidase [Bacteroidia bacterium]
MEEKIQVGVWLKQLQDNICKEIEKEDSLAKFKEDKWSRPGGGGGRSRVIENGAIIEKGGVNYSSVFGKLPSNIQKSLKLKEETEFFATGVSIVMHPVNPFVPIIHMNVRYFELDDGSKWFGGGIDLTPHYINVQEARFFHSNLKMECDKHHNSYYAQFKKWADDYFYIQHRNETRGVGGVFFDKLAPNNEFSFQDRFDFIKAIGDSFAPVYTQLMKNNAKKAFTDDHKKWQLIRRGRYVEFNLVYDKGTKFGLETNGRIESILMSLPPVVNWPYNFIPEKDSPEEKTLNLLKKNIDWLNA